MNKIIVIFFIVLSFAKGESLIIDKVDLTQKSLYSVPATLVDSLIEGAEWVRPGLLVTGYYENLALRFSGVKLPKNYYSRVPSYWKGFEEGAKSKDILLSLSYAGFSMCEIRCNVTPSFIVTNSRNSTNWHLYLNDPDRLMLEQKFKEYSSTQLRCKIKGYLSPPGVYAPYRIDSYGGFYSRLLIVTSVEVLTEVKP